jgi:hypothetical protein
VKTASAAIETAAGTFDVDAMSMKISALEGAGKAAKSPEDYVDLMEALRILIEDLVRADQYDAADKAAGAANGHARKSNDAALVARASSQAKEVSEAKSLYQSMKSAMETHAKNPDDPVANLEIGRFLCFVKGSWDLGLRFMVKGQDATLKGLAEKELSFPAQASDRASLADGWYDLAAKEKSPLRKNRLFAHARVVYESAIADAPGLLLAKIEKRLAELKSEEGKSGTLRAVSRTGLVAWWKCDEGKGTALSSSAGSGNLGTLNNGVEWTKGRFGNALKFNGKSHVAIKVANLPATNASQTISWWHLYPANPSLPEVILGLSDDAPTAFVTPGFKEGKIAVWKYMGGVLVSAKPPSVNAWHHCAYVYDGKRHSLYVDGKLEDSSTVPPQSAPVTKCEIGRMWGAGGTEYFTGLLDDVRIYSRPLTEAEIQALAAGVE